MEDTLKERAALGEETLKNQRAQGKPGEKQPEHKDARVSAEETVKQLDKLHEQIAQPTKESSAKRSANPGNLNKTPPEERGPGFIGDQPLAAANAAAAHISAARDQFTNQVQADARLLSDPRYERDQKVFELGQTGKLGLVPPAEAELAASAERAGLSPEVAEKVPQTPQEQVDEDMPRLEQAEKTAAQMTPGLPTGEQDELGKESSGTNVPAAQRTTESGQVRPGVKEGYTPPEKKPEEKKPDEDERDFVVR
jgi:hypothetical protein